MGLIVGLVLGAGVLCCWQACWPVASTPGTQGRLHGRWDRWRRDLDDALVQAGAGGVDARALLLACLLTGALGGLALLGLSRSPSIAVCFAAMAGWAPLALVRSRARRRRTSVRQVWPDAVDHLASGVRAGLSLPEALASLADRGPEPLRPAFRAFADDHRASGRFPSALEALKDRLADPVADRVVEALRLTREVGGSDLGRLLRTLSTFLRDDARTRAELEARQSWTVNGARLAVAAPWIVLGLLATQPSSVHTYDSPAGAVVLLVGALASVLAYRLMVRIGRLPEEERVLR